MSAHLQWMIIRNNNAYLLKKRNIRKPLSTEPNNLLNIASFRYNGLVHKKSIGIEGPPEKGGKGFVAVYKRAKAVKSYYPLEYAVLCGSVEWSTGSSGVRMTFPIETMHKPAKCTVKRSFKAAPRRSLHKLKRLIMANKYRTDLCKAALRRASAILKSQKRTVPVKKTRAKKAE
ncbi:60S ribosomal protein L28 [Homalodisca vitripennis]|nr:60S ribosomal protein L28 [Homalodisca vitripennis]